MTSRFARSLPFILLAIGVMVSFFIFIAIAEDYITHGSLVALDLHITHVLTASRSGPLLHFFYGVTILMNAVTIFVTGMFLTLVLWRQRAVMYLLILWLTLAGSTTLIVCTKAFFQRSRPEDFLPIVQETSYSFPSGHATIAVIVFGFLAYLFVRENHAWILKLCAIAVALVMIAFMDMSRLYLGVHYMSDVLAGNALGFGILFGSIALGEWHHAEHREQLPHIRRSVFLGVVLLQILCLLGFFLFTPLEF